MQEIRFYSTKGPYGYMSNFARYPIKDTTPCMCQCEKLIYPTSEHYYQASKTKNKEYAEKIRLAPNPKEAARLGRSSDCPMDPMWEDIKYVIMWNIVEKKFAQHPDIAQKLKETGDAILIEDSPTDYYWGCGADGSGKNMLGKILMKVRTELQKDAGGD